MDASRLEILLARVADALDRLAPKPPAPVDLMTADAFVWHDHGVLDPVLKISRVDLNLLKGIERQREILLDNTRRFAKGLPANNALLWGARGTGKSSLVKAIHATVNAELPKSLALVEIHREDVQTLPRLLKVLASSPRHFILFCDDLSFDGQDASYKSLKAVLDGGVEGRPANVVLYATSNRRHLMEEKVSVSDRFGIWLGFHNVDQDTYFSIIEGYASRYGIEISREQLEAEANEWSVTRGSRSGRVAWQFIQDLAGRSGKRIE
jgi:predicted AAA+ superfamily ATPase